MQGRDQNDTASLIASAEAVRGGASVANHTSPERRRSVSDRSVRNRMVGRMSGVAWRRGVRPDEEKHGAAHLDVEGSVRARPGTRGSTKERTARGTRAGCRSKGCPEHRQPQVYATCAQPPPCPNTRRSELSFRPSQHRTMCKSRVRRYLAIAYAMVIEDGKLSHGGLGRGMMQLLGGGRNAPERQDRALTLALSLQSGAEVCVCTLGRPSSKLILLLQAVSGRRWGLGTGGRQVGGGWRIGDKICPRTGEAG